VDDRERAEEWLEKACAWNSYKATDIVAEVTILRPPADDSLAAEFAAVRREEREACEARINVLTEAVRRLAIDRDDEHGSTMSCLLCDHGWTIGEPEEHSATCAAAIRAMSNVCTGCNSTPCVCDQLKEKK
jgi:hypothetical protein